MDIKLDLRLPDLDGIQATIEELQASAKDELNDRLKNILNGNRNALQSFLKGAYDNPKTWWIGVFTLQMQYGMYGSRLQSMARARADVLNQVLGVLWDETKGLIRDGKDAPILSNVVRYAFKHHPALITGRMVGGAFVTYTSTGGRLGGRAIDALGKGGSRGIRGTALFTNFGLASYGAGIMAIGLGNAKIQDVLFTILTGSAERLPPYFMQVLGNAAMTAEERATEEWLRNALGEIAQMTRVGSGPVPIKEFCSRPENIDLKAVCG